MAVAHVDAVVLTAVPEEDAAVVRALGDCAVHRWRGQTLRVGRVGALTVLAFPMGGMGNVSSAQAATLAISVWNPGYIMLVGITAGIKDAGDDLRLGDVVVPDRIVGYEQAKVHPQGVERRYEVVQPSWKLLQAARGLEPREWALSVAATRPDGQGDRVVPRVHFGPVFSGEKVVADEATVPELRKAWPKAVGLEMEALGVGIASYRGCPEFLMIKAVSDFADPAKSDDWHAYAAESAARFAVALLRNPAIQSEPERPQATPVSVPCGFSGALKVQFCRRLRDSWVELADFFEVPVHETARFRPGDEPRDLWEWLEARGKLPLVPEVLGEVGRGDLAQLMWDFRR
jgi:nucleoside phosphorylase